jgi:hypothetical protein
VADVVFALGVLLQLIVLTGFARTLWFAMDDWEFLLHRGILPEADHGWNTPYNGHWSIVTIAIYRALFAVFGMHSYLPYALVTILFHLANAVLVLLLLRRGGAGPWVSVAGAWVVLFMGAGGDAILYSAAMNHTGAVTFGLLATWLVSSPSRSRGRSVAAVGLLVLAVMFSATGIAAVAFCAAWIVLGSGVPRTLRIVAGPAVIYLTWYLLVGHRQGNGYLPSEGWTYLQLPQRVWAGMSGALDKAVGLTGVGPILLLTLLAIPFVARSAPSGLRRLAFAGNLTALLEALLVSLTRMQLDPSTTRFAYVIVVFMAPSMALVVVTVVPMMREYRGLGVLIAAAGLMTYAINGVLAERTFYQTWRGVTQSWPAVVGGMLQAVDAGEHMLVSFGGDFYNAGVDPSLVSKPRIRQSLPLLPRTESGRVAAEGMYMVQVGPTSSVVSRPGSLSDLDSIPGDIAQVSGCRTYTPTAPHPVLVLGTGDGNAVQVSSASTEVVTTLNRNGINSGSRTWPVSPGSVHVSTTAKDALLFMTFNSSGNITICM